MLFTSLAQLKNGFEKVLIDEKKIVDYKEAWRMLIVSDWRLKGFGQVQHQI